MTAWTAAAAAASALHQPVERGLVDEHRCLSVSIGCSMKHESLIETAVADWQAERVLALVECAESGEASCHT